MIKELRIVGTKLKMQQLKKLGPKALNKKNYWDRSKSLIAKLDS